jgi:hypothetical protein
MFVKNAGQEQNYPADSSNDGDGAGDACNTGERHAECQCVGRACAHSLACVLRCIPSRLCDAAGCHDSEYTSHEACLIGCDSIASQSPRDSIKSCTSPFRGGRYHNDLRCVPGYAYIEGTDFGCEKL